MINSKEYDQFFEEWIKGLEKNEKVLKENRPFIKSTSKDNEDTIDSSDLSDMEDIVKSFLKSAPYADNPEVAKLKKSLNTAQEKNKKLKKEIRNMKKEVKILKEENNKLKEYYTRFDILDYGD